MLPILHWSAPLRQRHPTALPSSHRAASTPPTPRKRKAPPSASKSQPPPQRRPPPRLEFRAPVDGAWYDARVAVQCGALRVMYEGFPEELDEWLDPAALAAAAACARDVAALRARFRAASLPLDDARCGDLRAGAPLCVSCQLEGGELKFYDAVLASVRPFQVLPAAHVAVDGKKQCACRFAVRWTEGPRAGSMEDVGVERVCCVQSSPVNDPVLTEFLDGMAKRLGENKGEATAFQETVTVAAAEAPPGFHRKFGAGMR
ncbi:hypothetical protein U9M48_043794 [Paspalum notatum var. saurae]|uniref:SAWADEE domain-containing protein n=1 Tax=Paspalum notatum var. saurae TaxID=547442 RepID=A0AAQ3XHH2_PASNO